MIDRRDDLAWLVRLRTAAIAGAAFLLALAGFGLNLAFPWPNLAAVLALWAGTNIAASMWTRRPVGEGLLTLLMAVDAVFLTAVFHQTGGPSNPFNFLYLVHIALAAVVLTPRRAWALGVLSTMLFGLLFVDHVPLPQDNDGHDHHDMALHLRGMWLAFAIAAGFILTFVSRVTRALAARERDLADARAEAVKAGRLASLATLAAGAAHELATPLSTIALVAKELEHDLHGQPSVDDARLIREQVERCRQILMHLRADAGDSSGEAPVSRTPRELVDDALAELDTSHVQVQLDEALAHRPLKVYARSIAEALRRLIENALEASHDTVTVAATIDGPDLVLSVTDDGAGMDADTLARVGEPFFTTKPTGRGMGLGVYVARSIAERLGGRLELTSTIGAGTTAAMVLPLQDAP